MEEEFLSLEQIIAEGNDKFYVIEDQIDVDIQSSYFAYSQKIKEKGKEQFSDLNSDLLYDDTLSVKEKKKLLVRLATSNNVIAYRVLEKFRLVADPVIKDWATLAYNEARMLLENALSEERQIFISTGMGGKGDKLRYFMVLFAKDESGFTPFEKKFVLDETQFTFAQNKCKIERVESDELHFVAFTVLIPLKSSIQKIMHRTFENCNQLGKFIHQKFIISNMKEMTKSEINDFFKSE